MDWCTLDVMVHNAKGLKDVALFGSMNPYAVVWIEKHDDFKQRGKLRTHKTDIAKKRASSPVWNHHMEFNLGSSHKHYTLFCEIRNRGKLFDRKIGEVQVALRSLRVVGQKIRYPVKISSFGKAMGEIVLSHMFSPNLFEPESEAGSRIAKADELDVLNDYRWNADEDEDE